MFTAYVVYCYRDKPITIVNVMVRLSISVQVLCVSVSVLG